MVRSANLATISACESLMTHPSSESCSPLMHLVPEETQITSAADGNVDVRSSAASASMSAPKFLDEVFHVTNQRGGEFSVSVFGPLATLAYLLGTNCDLSFQRMDLK